MDKNMPYKSNPVYSNEIILKGAKYWYISLSENQYYLGRAIIILKDFSKQHLYELEEKKLKNCFF